MKSIPSTPDLVRYLMNAAPLPSRVLPALREETLAMPGSVMQITAEQGVFMHFLAKLIGAKKILEIGCYTGYSAICLASALPEDGRLITLDIDPRMTVVAERYLKEAGLNERVEIRLGQALESISRIISEEGLGSFDMIFIDADKANMKAYYEAGLKLLRPGGLIICDNVLWGGTVTEDYPTDERAQAVKAFNLHVAGDERVDRSLINLADGLYLVRKR